VCGLELQEDPAPDVESGGGLCAAQRCIRRGERLDIGSFVVLFDQPGDLPPQGVKHFFET